MEDDATQIQKSVFIDNDLEVKAKKIKELDYNVYSKVIGKTIFECSQNIGDKRDIEAISKFFISALNSNIQMINNRN